MKGVIFDMDGVIIDSEPLHFKIERELLEEIGGKITTEEHKKFVGTTDYYMWSTFKKQFNIKLSVEEIISIKKKRFIENIDKIKPVDNIFDLIKALHKENYILGLASSNNKKVVNLIIEKFQLDRYLNISISGEEVSKGKPDPEIFLTTAKYMNLKPENCLVIEDAETGVIAAKTANMKCIGFQNKNSGEQDLTKADLIIDNFKNLTINDMKSLFK